MSIGDTSGHTSKQLSELVCSPEERSVLEIYSLVSSAYLVIDEVREVREISQKKHVELDELEGS